MKFLVVDDSSMIRSLIRDALTQAGYEEICEAVDGEEAVRLISDQEFDLILMDWSMPKATGLEAVYAIRARGDHTPIVLVTTEAEKSRVAEAIRAGISDYLVKPFTQEQLLERVEKFVTETA